MADPSLLNSSALFTDSTNVESSVAWLLNRVGFGATTAEFDHARRVGLERFLTELFDPDSLNIPDQGDPWSQLDLPFLAGSPRDMLPAVMAWTERMTSASQPVTEWLAWYWHGHLVSSYIGARTPLGLVGQIRLFRTLGDGSFPELLRAVTIDAAMLRYLDGDTSTGANPNENYSRELLELFALGVGHYTEDDVRAGAAALTGWTRVRGSTAVIFRPRRHDDTIQRYLGVDGVNDVDSVIAAVVDHDACAPFVMGKLADAILGPGASFDRQAEADRFRADGMKVRPLVRRLVELGLNGGSSDFSGV